MEPWKHEGRRCDFVEQKWTFLFIKHLAFWTRGKFTGFTNGPIEDDDMLP
jgi:hypothetical protein